MQKILLASSLLLAGCATQTGVIPTGENKYMVLNQGNGFWASTSVLNADATREASRYCESKGKTLKILNSREQGVGFRPGAYPEAEVQFSCM